MPVPIDALTRFCLPFSSQDLLHMYFDGSYCHKESVLMNSRMLFPVLLCCAIIASFVTSNPTAQAALITGDIAIIGVYTDGTSNDATGGGDSFAWVPLVDLAPGEVIHFSDAGYFTGTTSFNATEGLLTYTVPVGGISAGVVQAASNDVAPNDLSLQGLATAGTGYSTGPSAYSAGGHVNLSGSGDQLVAFQDSDLNDVAGFSPLFAVNMASDNWTPGVSIGDSNQTNLYPGLTDAANAVAVGSGAGNQDEFDNARYIGITSGTRGALLAAIADATNWEKTDDAQTAPTRDWSTNGVAQFNVLPVPEPSTVLMTSLMLIGFSSAGSRSRAN